MSLECRPGKPVSPNLCQNKSGQHQARNFLLLETEMMEVLAQLDFLRHPARVST